jgi:hypothetical protein
MKKLIILTSFVFIAMAPWTGSSVRAGDGGATVDVIIQTEGSTDTLVESITAVGGTVSFQYKNVPAVAASVPVGKLAAVARVSGVSKIEKDQLIYLPGESPDAQDKVHPTSFKVEDVTGIQLKTIDPAAVTAGGCSQWLRQFSLHWSVPHVGRHRCR